MATRRARSWFRAAPRRAADPSAVDLCERGCGVVDPVLRIAPQPTVGAGTGLTHRSEVQRAADAIVVDVGTACDDRLAGREGG